MSEWTVILQYPCQYLRTHVFIRLATFCKSLVRRKEHEHTAESAHLAPPLGNGADELLGADVNNVSFVLVDEGHLRGFVGQWHHQVKILEARILERHLMYQRSRLGMTHKQRVLHSRAAVHTEKE